MSLTLRQKIELRHLRYFIAVAEELNFKRAAERVHIDPTPLTRTIRDLEEQLGVQLLLRSHRKMRLTPAGARMLREGQKILLRLDRAYRVVRETDRQAGAPLRIGVADGISDARLIGCLSAWRKATPGPPPDLIELRARELAHALHWEDIDVGFSFGLARDPVIAQQRVWEHPLQAVLRVDHPLAAQPSISFPELEQDAFLGFCPDFLPGLHAQVQDILHRHHATSVSAKPARTLKGYMTRIALGCGAGLMDAGHVAVMARAQLVAVPLREDERISTYVAYKRGRIHTSAAIRSFIAHVEATATS